MCIVCQNKAPINGLVDCSLCINITNDILKVYVKNHTITYLGCYRKKITEIPHIVGLEKLGCSNTNITEIPNIIGLKILRCYDTSITEIPHISGLKELYCDGTNITEIPHIDGLKKLYCSNTNITEIPNIVGLKQLWCSNTNITEIPHIKGCHIIIHYCHWLEQENIEKVITSQKMMRNYYMRKKLVHIRDQLMPIYFHPEMKGGYLHKKSMMADF